MSTTSAETSSSQRRRSGVDRGAEDRGFDLNSQIQNFVRAEVQRVLPELLADLVRVNIEDDSFVDTREAARVTGLSRQFFECGRSTRNPNQPRHYKIGRRVLYRRNELIEWVRRRAET